MFIDLSDISSIPQLWDEMCVVEIAKQKQFPIHLFAISTDFIITKEQTQCYGSLHSFSACIIINSIHVSASILSIRSGMRTSLWRSIFVFLFSPSAGVCRLCLFSFKLVASPSPFIRLRRAIIARAKITIGHGPETHQTIWLQNRWEKTKLFAIKLSFFIFDKIHKFSMI